MDLINKILTGTIALGLAGSVSLNTAKEIPEIEKEKILIRHTLKKFARCIENEDKCTADYFIDDKIHQNIDCPDDNITGDYASSEPWADMDRKTFKITPTKIYIIPYDKGRASYLVYAHSRVSTRCLCAGACLETFGRNGESSTDCLSGEDIPTMGNYEIDVIYKLFKVGNNYYIDNEYEH